MKRKTIMKLMALTVASTLMVGSTMSVFAAEGGGIGFNDDDWENDGGTSDHVTDGASNNDIWGWEDQSSSDSGSTSENTVSNESANTTETVQPESTGNSGSNSESTQPSNSASTSTGSASNASAGSTSSASSTLPNSAATAAPATAKTIDKTGKAAVPGYETFIQAVSAGSGTYKVTHCGDVKAILQLTDADGNAVGGKSIALAPMADGRYAVAFTSNDAAATYTVATTKGDATYLPRLGIVAVTVDGNVVRDLVAEEAAAQAAAAK